MQANHSNSSAGKYVTLAIALLVAFYGYSLSKGWPQLGRDTIIEAEKHSEHPAAHGKEDEHTGHASAEHKDAEHEEEGEGHHDATITPPHIALVAPFAILLGCIALLPLLRKTEHWWESNLHRFYVAAGLGVLTLLYFLLLHDHPIVSHWPAHGHVTPDPGASLQWGLAGTVFANAILNEFIPFIVLLFALYTISGGIRIEGNLPAHPLTNTCFIAVGGLLASFIGTTGAAMLLIRPLLETNKERKHVVHTVVFFIFIVCNCGGCLLPIGDPPLFLGYLRKVDFLWTLNLWPQWLFVNVVLLAVYWAWDQFFSYPKETIKDISRDEHITRGIKISGWIVNAPLLIGVVLCVALLDPKKPVLGTSFHAPMYLREIAQLFLVGLSIYFGSDEVRKKNHFNYHAIVEVAALFFGIFLCMQPALQILDVQGKKMGLETAQQYFWCTGGLSAVLDNAPTYVVFFETAKASAGGVIHPVTVIDATLLTAISLGAVFMGAMTYIGNGPNFMVKAIAETSGIKMPSFFGYMKWSFCILLPILVVTTLIFL